VAESGFEFAGVDDEGRAELVGRLAHLAEQWREDAQVTWASLEDEPATYAVGFSVPDDDETHYPGLGLLTEDEFSRRERALQDRLASGENLSGWVPPWSRGDSPP